MSPFRPTAYPSTPCLLPSSPALPFPRPSPGGLQALGFGRHQVPVTATQLCHCSVEAPVTVGMSLFVFKCSFTGKTREREQAGLGLSLVVCQSVLWPCGDWGRRSEGEERGHFCDLQCPSTGVTESRLVQLSFLGLEAGSSPRPAGLDEINVPHAYWVASLCPVFLLLNPAHPFASSYTLLSSNGSI